MAPVRGDGMRGLAVFISDIRNCEYSSGELHFTLHHSFSVLINLDASWRTPGRRENAKRKVHLYVIVSRYREWQANRNFPPKRSVRK